MIFSREPLTRELCAEMFPLFELHYAEIAHFQDIPLDPNVDQYIAVEQSGALRAFTARGDDGALCGYALFFIKHSAHYRSSLQAVQDILFIHPEKRGTGMDFIQWCDEQLQFEGVQAVYHSVSQFHDFGHKLEALGYQPVDRVYAKRLD